MYLDSVGKVTVATGLMLADVAAAMALPFQFAGQVADAGDVRADYLRVEKMPPNKVAGFYHSDTSPTLSQAAMQQITSDLLLQFDSYLRRDFPMLDQYPDSAKSALLDMTYNLGPTGVMKFKRMIAAIEAGDWTVAANESNRPQLNADRNLWTKQQFLEAAQ